MSIEKVKVGMGVSELMFLIVLVGLALFGGEIKFNGVARNGKKQPIKDSKQKLLDE